MEVNKINEILNFLKELPLIDKILVGFQFNSNSIEKNVELYFSREIDERHSLVLVLKKVTLFDMYIDDDVYYISDYKLLFREESNDFYLSLDPDNSKADETDTDKGLIIFSEIFIDGNVV